MVSCLTRAHAPSEIGLRHSWKLAKQTFKFLLGHCFSPLDPHEPILGQFVEEAVYTYMGHEFSSLKIFLFCGVVDHILAPF